MHQSKPAVGHRRSQTIPQSTNDAISGTVALSSQPSPEQQGQCEMADSKQTPPGKKLMPAFVKKMKNGAASAEYRNELGRLLPGPPNRISPSGTLDSCSPAKGIYSSGELHKLVQRELKSNGFESALGKVQVVSADFYRNGTGSCIRLDLQGKLGCFSGVLMICLPVPPTTKRHPPIQNPPLPGPSGATQRSEKTEIASSRSAYDRVVAPTSESLGVWGAPIEGVPVNAPDTCNPGTPTKPVSLIRVGVLPYDDPLNHVTGHDLRGDPLVPGAIPRGTREAIFSQDHPPDIVASSYRTTMISLGDSFSEVINSPVCDEFSAKQAESTRAGSPSNLQRETASSPISQDSHRSVPHRPGGSQPSINTGRRFTAPVGGVLAVNYFIKVLPGKRRVIQLALGARGVCSRTINTLTGMSPKMKARYFRIMTPGQADQFVAPLKATEPSQLIVRDPKILLEDVSVLASIVSSRGSQHPGACRLDSWFLDAMWEGLSQLCYTNQVDDVKHEEPEGAMRVLVDDVMSRFGKRAKKFRSKIRRDATKRPELDGSKFMPHQGTDQPDEETEANLKAADVLAKKNENLEQEKRRLEERYEELLLAERKLK